MADRITAADSDIIASRLLLLQVTPRHLASSEGVGYRCLRCVFMRRASSLQRASGEERVEGEAIARPQCVVANTLARKIGCLNLMAFCNSLLLHSRGVGHNSRVPASQRVTFTSSCLPSSVLALDLRLRPPTSEPHNHSHQCNMMARPHILPRHYQLCCNTLTLLTFRFLSSQLQPTFYEFLLRSCRPIHQPPHQPQSRPMHPNLLLVSKPSPATFSEARTVKE